MPDKDNEHVAADVLIYNSENNYLILNGQQLQEGASLEIYVFGSWIPGQVALDGGGWYLTTLDQVGIRLHTGLPARSGAFSITPSVAQPPCTPSSRILLVDDDKDLLQALPHMVALRLPDVLVDTSQTAPEALLLLQQRKYDAVVSDIKMPGMDGLTLLAQSRELQPETPTLLITGHGDHTLAIQALRSGAYDYIQKPIDRDEFVATLLRAIQACQLRRRVEEQQRALESHARSLERLVQQRTQELIEAHATKDKVIGIVSYELNEPITRLKDMLNLLRQKLANEEVAEIVSQSFGDIEQSLERIEALVQELLTASGIETQTFILHKRHCDLVDVCQKILEEDAGGHDLQISSERSGGPVMVDVDVDQMRLVLNALLDSASTAFGEEDEATIMLQHTGYEAIITLRDHGARHSLGVGFYISRKIVERHGGHLEVQDFPGDKRALFLMLPLLDEAGTEKKGKSGHRTRATWTITRS